MIKVLIVDDSFVVRRLLADILNADPGIEVNATARNGVEAIQKITETDPDVVTLDLMMPGPDGLTTLKRIMHDCPRPVVILSAHSKEGADITMDCLEAGAVSFLLKPSGEFSLDVIQVKNHLLNEVKAAARVDIKKVAALLKFGKTSPKPPTQGKGKIFVIGASTGGPQTLESIFAPLPAHFFAPIIVAQHMPTKEFSESFAAHLNKISALSVTMARNNQALAPGRAYLVPGGNRMLLRKKPEDEHAVMYFEETGSGGPSIDAVMRETAAVYRGHATGIILTGLGTDGLDGMRAIHEAGGRTIAEDESSLIDGMPGAVRDAGYADEAMPADKIMEMLLKNTA